MSFDFNQLLFLIALHFIGDFPFQSEFLALGKGKSWELNFYHVAIYTSVFIVFGKISFAAACILFISHFFIDPLKARWAIVRHIWQDQILHIAVLIIIVLFNI